MLLIDRLLTATERGGLLGSQIAAGLSARPVPEALAGTPDFRRRIDSPRL